MTRPQFAQIATITVGLLLAACSGSHSTAARTTTTPPSTPSTIVSTTLPATTVPPSATLAPSTTVSPSTVRVVSFTGPPSPVQCFAQQQSIQLHWETRNASSVTLRINGGDVFATYKTNSFDDLVPLTCDGTTQTYLVTARGPNGEVATASLTLQERATT